MIVAVASASRRAAHRRAFLAAMIATLVGLAGHVSPCLAEETSAASFAWNREHHFRELEQLFERARQQSLANVRQDFQSIVTLHRRALATVSTSDQKVPFGALLTLEQTQFQLAALAAAHEALLADAHALITQARLVVVQAARRWPVERTDVHEVIYRVQYGGRAAIEEALVQQRTASLPTLTPLEAVASSAPSTLIEGVRVHSGDIILSRGDAPTSALIARGNSFPGNFSHVAIVHVDASSGNPTVIESLIERGLVTTSAEEFLKEKRLRLLLLRLRPNDPAVQKDPLAAHRAATAMLESAATQHIPYDFAMDWQNPASMFCSEVAHFGYRAVGVDLWAYKPKLTSPGLVRWLGDMGVKHFTTLIPSDLEYDPKLAPVTEWRNAETLLLDRLDNVTLDVLLEAAERGDRLGYAPLTYVPGALAKLWSGVQSALGATPVIPRGMSVETALRVRSLVNTVHPRLRAAIAEAADRFEKERGYLAPYWTLTELARKALGSLRSELAPALTAAPDAP